MRIVLVFLLLLTPSMFLVTTVCVKEGICGSNGVDLRLGLFKKAELSCKSVCMLFFT